MKVIYVTLLIFFAFSLNVSSQTGTIKIAKPEKNNVKSDTTFGGITPCFGYIWQNTNNFEIGLYYIFNKKVKTTVGTNFKKNSLSYLKKKNNLALNLGGDVFKHNVYYCSPYINLYYFRNLNNPKLIYRLNLIFNYSYTKANKKEDHRISPEIGCSIGHFSISYGYNIPVGKEKISFISPHRIAIRLTYF